MDSALHARLEENELVFLRRHRSATYELGFGTLFISSEPDSLTWNFVGALHPSAAGLAGWSSVSCVCLSLRALPGSRHGCVTLQDAR